MTQTDRARAEDTGLPLALATQAGTPERPPLASLVEMQGLLRNYLSRAAETYDQYLAHEISNTDASTRGLELAQELANTLLGKRDAGYTLIPWFSPDQLGRYVLREIGYSGTPEEAVNSAVLGLFFRLYDVIRLAQSEFRDIQDYLPTLDLAITQSACLFLSLPIPAALPKKEPKMPFTHCPECDNRAGCAEDQNCYKAELAKPDPPYTPESPAVERANNALNAVLTTVKRRKKELRDE